MERVDYTALYEQNADFKRYVDRYCTKHRVSVDEALQHYLVQMAEKLKVCWISAGVSSFMA